MKRIFDIILSFFLLILFSPVFLICAFLIWSQDRFSPFYVADRVGIKGRLFRMIKFRSMIVNASKTGVDSTSANDSRITPLGHFMRKYKLDELPQLINVLFGQMSFVGPRPNVKKETDLYSQEEQKILGSKPGITDLASIVFSDEGNILQDSKDPDIDYNQLIRPWKSRLGILYVHKQSLLLDIHILYLTFLCLIDRRLALQKVQTLLVKLKAEKALIDVCRRTQPLVPAIPPGLSSIVTSRLVIG